MSTKSSFDSVTVVSFVRSVLIHCWYIMSSTPEEVTKLGTELRNRFDIATTIKEILQFHRFVPLSQTHLVLYKLSTQVSPANLVAVTAQAEHDKISEVRIDIEISEQNYVCCLYDNEP